MGSTINKLMKKILTFIFILISLTSLAQNDSSRIKIDATIQARDLEVILFYTQQGGMRRVEDIDSALLSKWRSPSVAPQGTTLVTIDDIEARVWLHAFRLIFDNIAAVQEGTVDRVAAALTAANLEWLSNKIANEMAARNDAWQAIRKIGREYGKKETTGF